MKRYRFDMVGPTQGEDGWTYGMGGKVYGPFESHAAAWHASHLLFLRYKARAVELGGDAWRARGCVWGVSLPDDVPCDGAPFVWEQMTRHGPG